MAETSTTESTKGVETSDQPIWATQEATAEYHFSLAQAYSAEGNPDRAIEEYKITLFYDPKSALVNTRLAAEYVRKNMFSSAMEFAKAATVLDPNFADARLILGGLYAESGQIDAAIGEYDEILRQQPNNEEAAVYKAQLLTESSRAKEAISWIRVFLKDNSQSAVGWYYLGRAEQRQENFPEAIRAFQKSLEIRKDFAQAALALGYIYETKGMNDRALSVYQRIYDDSQDLTAASRISSIYLKQEKYKAAIPYLEAVQAADPDDLNAQVKLGLVYMELKDSGAAERIFGAILKKNPDSDRVRYYLAHLYEQSGRTAEAVGEFAQIEVGSKFFEDAKLHMTFLLNRDGKRSEALSEIRHAIEKSPGTIAFYLYQANLEEEAAAIPQATATLERAVEKFPEDEKARYYLGSLYDRQGQTEKSLKQMETILKYNPDHADALNYLGYTWTTLGIRLDDAEKLLRHAVSLKPDNGYIQDSWGWHLYTRGRLSEAVVELEKAAKLKPTESIILEHLGDAYLKKNLWEKALHQYREAERFAQDQSGRDQIESKIAGVLKQIAVLQPGQTPVQKSGQARLPASNNEK